MKSKREVSQQETEQYCGEKRKLGSQKVKEEFEINYTAQHAGQR